MKYGDMMSGDELIWSVTTYDDDGLATDDGLVEWFDGNATVNRM